MENPNNVTHLPEEIVTEILARLPLRSISRFKSVCKTWKSTLESLYFRRLFLCRHKEKSRSWSQASCSPDFMTDFHRCETWGLPNSIGYYFQNILESGDYKDSSNGLVLFELDLDPYFAVTNYYYYYVGNPILQQWVVIPIPIPNGYPGTPRLVTRVDEDGVVLSFKVVLIHAKPGSEDRSLTCLYSSLYSSETGIWTSKQLNCPHYLLLTPAPLVTQHGMLYIGDNHIEGDRDVIIAYDIYGESNVCRVIPLPDPDLNNNRTLTTSTEFVIYIKTSNNVLKVWRLLNSDDDSPWEPMWETRLQFIPSDENIISPVTMNPFDRNIVYIWSRKNNYLVSCNLETQSYHIFIDQLQDGDLQNCLVNHYVCEKHMDDLCVLHLYGNPRISYTNFRYVFPRWMGSVPCPPRTKILDTSSVLSHMKSIS